MTAPLRVLFMAGSLDGGGSERQTLLLLQQLDRVRFAPELYLTYRKGALLSHVPNDVPVHAFDDCHRSSRWWWPGREHGRLVAHLRSLIQSRKVDVVYDRTFHMSLIAGPAARGVAPRVSVMVSPPHLDLPHSENRFLRLKRARLRTAYCASSQLLAVSDAVRKSAVEYYRLSPGQVATLHNPIDCTQLVVRGAETPAAAMAPDRSHLVCIGRMTHEKGHDILLAALAQLRSDLGRSLPALEMWFIGDGPLRTLLQESAREIESPGLKIHFTGYLDNPHAILSRSQGLIMPSRYEGLPNSVLEAGGLGIPVIATDVGGTSEVLSSQQYGHLVPSEDPAAMSAAIAELLRSPVIASMRAQKLRERIELEYSVPTYLTRISALLETAAGRS